ncbi:MAG TPA: nitroreductase [Syntrophorhabdales bacterium]|nr:nitroreductase [Syntrophorhabdales bacterium]
MDVSQAVRERRSIRAFKPDPVAQEQVEEILRIATCAPSAINLQPWEFTVVLGEERERLSRRLIKAYKEKQITCAPGNVKPLPSEVIARGVEAAEGMKPFLSEKGIEFNQFVNEGSCNFYGAPVAIIICIDKAFSQSNYVDIGIVLGYLLLIAHSAGLSTCPIGLITAYSDEIKDELGIPETKSVIIGVAMGFPEDDDPINRFKSSRDAIDKFVRWID